MRLTPKGQRQEAEELFTEILRPHVSELIQRHGFSPVDQDTRLAAMLDGSIRARTSTLRSLFSPRLRNLSQLWQHIYDPARFGSNRLEEQVIPAIVSRLEKEAGVTVPPGRPEAPMPKWNSKEELKDAARRGLRWGAKWTGG